MLVGLHVPEKEDVNIESADQQRGSSLLNGLSSNI